jgi:dipeptidyl aminopeptidase/acylaminoacyl peptidase
MPTMLRSRRSPALAALLLAAVSLPAALQAQARRPITFEDFAAIRAVSDPQLGPDGRQVLYAVRTADVEANRRATATMLASVDGGASRRFPDDTTNATEARWSPDGRLVAFVSGDQLWVARPDGSERRRLTSLAGGATGPVWSPRGDMILFTSAVYPACADDACNAARMAAAAASKVKAHIADSLLFRHWTTWDEGQRSHLFVVTTNGQRVLDLTRGATYDVPVPPFGGSEGYSWAPDGMEVAYTAKANTREAAWTTDLNVYTVRADGMNPTPQIVTAANRGADQNPTYTPDGRYIAYASQRRAGFEADRWRLMVYDRQTRQSRELLPTWDRSADAWTFASDMSTLYVAAQDRGRDKLFRVALRNGAAAGTPAIVLGEHNNTAFSFSRDARAVAWTRDATERPAEVYVAALDGAAPAARQLTHENDALVARLAVNGAEDFWFRGAKGDSLHGFVVRPPNWEAGKKYPVVLLVHGGPQGAFLDQWHGRWNYQMFAAPGYAVVIVNPRGSTGYGQRITDEVSKDWGGKVYTDLMLGLDAALARNPWMDSTRMGAAGGSFGGYMMNWFAGHTNRFKALVSHAGPFNLESMYGATEEIWFPEWEYGPYWDDAAMRTQYRRWSPHLYVRNFRTPMLVLHGELDYRVPYTEGLQLFTALQRRNVPSRLVVFPDEGHWIGKPQNQRLWWSEVQGWLGRWLGGGA